MGVQRAAPNAALLLAVASSVSNLHSQKPFTYLPPALFYPSLSRVSPAAVSCGVVQCT